MRTKIGVVGAGKWGLALAYALSEKNDVVISSRRTRDIKNFIPMQELLECEYLVITVPAQQVSQWLNDNFKFKNHKILVASKGIEASSGKFLISLGVLELITTSFFSLRAKAKAEPHFPAPIIPILFFTFSSY